MPGRRPSLRQIRSYLFACAASSVARARRRATPRTSTSSCRRARAGRSRSTRRSGARSPRRRVRVSDGVRAGAPPRRAAVAGGSRCARRAARTQPTPSRRCEHRAWSRAAAARSKMSPSHVERAGHVRAGEAELARRGEDVTQRVRRAHHERRRGVGGAERAAVVTLDADRKIVAVGAEQVADDLGEALRRCGGCRSMFGRSMLSCRVSVATTISLLVVPVSLRALMHAPYRDATHSNHGERRRGCEDLTSLSASA